MEFYSVSNPAPMIYHDKCEMVTPKYEEKINKKTLEKELVKVGETNTYEMIQASRDATDIQKIIERYQINIDDKISINDEILDYTGYPEDLIEAHQRILTAEQIWKQEPASIKAEFNNNFEQYLAAANNGTLINAYEKVSPKKVEKIKKAEEPTNVENVQQQQAELLNNNNGGNVNE